MKLGIVCGYGTDLNNDIEGYLNSVLEFSINNNINKLILTGGITQKSSKISEASLMHQILVGLNLDLEIVLEEESITTLHNLLYSQKIINSFDKKIEKLYIFCDAVRIFKVFCLSKIIFNNYSFETIYFQRKENLLIYCMQIPSTIIQALGVIFPELEKMIITSRQKWNELMDSYKQSK
ncbi:YdcF family protein [Calothrix membranacea FACHB-236]|nr:YdcF family protein [Calothrix membranacea FACHB-236]